MRRRHQNDPSQQSINMLVDSVLNRHGVKLSKSRLSIRPSGGSAL